MAKKKHEKLENLHTLKQEVYEKHTNKKCTNILCIIRPTSHHINNANLFTLCQSGYNHTVGEEAGCQ